MINKGTDMRLARPRGFSGVERCWGRENKPVESSHVGIKKSSARVQENKRLEDKEDYNVLGTCRVA